MDSRKALDTGEILRLGDLACRIESEEGRGGSAIVYRASYQDSLNFKQTHHVLVKELFPWTADSSIFRAPDGGIRCTDAGIQIMEDIKTSFLEGNNANLTLLARMPQQVSGNLNSYEAYGTYYSLLTIHGGKSLMQILESRQGPMDLRETAQIGIWILDSLSCFHDCGLLHLDISPDNILILSSCAMLIDYNSVWRMDDPSDSFRFSMKPGYVPPEIQMKDLNQIGTCSDLYSVAAVLFRMLTGRRLTSEDVLSGSGGLSADLPAFQNVPPSAASMMLRILQKGLHMLARKRYQSCGEMRRDLEEVLLRLDRKGVTRASLWEGSRSECVRQSRRAQRPYLPRKIRLEADGRELTEAEVMDTLCAGEHILLCGIGGRGKSSFLLNLWSGGSQRYSERAPVFFYVPLAGFQEAGQEPYYIRKYLLRQLNLADQRTMEESLMELNRLLQPEDGARRHKWIFLLDGLKEAGPRSEALLKEIETLSAIPGVGILATDRSADVQRYALRDFRAADLLPLSESAVQTALRARGLSLPKDAALSRALTNPMMLSLYQQIQEMVPEGDAPAETRMRDMIDRYMDALCTRQLRQDSGSERDQLRRVYLLRQLLPEIARRMRKSGRNYLSRAKLESIVSADYRLLRSRALSAAFPDYAGKSRLMLEGIANAQEWFDYAISEELAGRFGLLENTDEGGFRFAHDNFMECLAENGKRNHEALLRVRIRRSSKWAVAGAAAIAVLCLVVMLALPRSLSESELQLINRSADQLITNTNIVNLQLYDLGEALDDMTASAVKNGNANAIQNVRSGFETILSETNVWYARYYVDTEDYIAGLSSALGGSVPADTLTELLQAPTEMQAFLEASLTLLESQLDEDALAEALDTAEVLIEYVDAYTNVYYLLYVSVLQSFDELGAEEAANDLVACMDDLGSAFTTCRIYYGLGNLSDSQLEEKYADAEEALTEAEAKVTEAGLPVISH